MRANEFIIEVNDRSPSALNLVDTLEEIRSRTDQIRVDSLVNLVRRKPGSEMFNVDILMDLFKNNNTVKNMISDIKRDRYDIGQIYLKNLAQSDDIVSEPEKPEFDSNKSDLGSNFDPQKTISTMAKRAAKKRI